MSWFDAIKKAGEALAKGPIPSPPPEEKPSNSSSPPAEKQPKTTPKRSYRRIVKWLKESYGDRFVQGASTEEIEKQLTKIMKENVESYYKGQDPKYLKGFREYISRKEYGELVSVE
jgi:hypothetical protein